jgi:hypothetical protein
MSWHWSLDKTRAIIAAVWFAVGCLCGFFMGKGVYHQPVSESVTRDTVRIVDTIPHYYPKPVAEERVRYVTRSLPVVKTDTIFRENSASFRENSVTDSVAVVVPITQKHYRALEYDAYVSGYEANLDSIKVYRQKEFITETVIKTISPKRKPWGLGLHAGYGYDFKSKTAAPFIGVGISYDIISF